MVTAIRQMTCPRCSGRLYPNRYVGGVTETSCFSCGYVDWGTVIRDLPAEKPKAVITTIRPDQVDTSEDMIETAEAARILDRNISVAARLCKSGTLPAIIVIKRAGRPCYSIRRADVLAYKAELDKNTPPPDSNLITVESAVDILGCSIYWAGELAKKGSLKAVKMIGKHKQIVWMFDPQDVEDYRESIAVPQLDVSQVNTEQAAKLLGVAKGRVRDMASQGLLPGRNLSANRWRHNWIFALADVAAYARKRDESVRSRAEKARGAR